MSSCVDYYGFGVIFEIGKYEYSNFVLFFKFALAISESLEVHIKFRRSFSI